MCLITEGDPRGCVLTVAAIARPMEKAACGQTAPGEDNSLLILQVGTSLLLAVPCSSQVNSGLSFSESFSDLLNAAEHFPASLDEGWWRQLPVARPGVQPPGAGQCQGWGQTACPRAGAGA